MISVFISKIFFILPIDSVMYLRDDVRHIPRIATVEIISLYSSGIGKPLADAHGRIVVIAKVNNTTPMPNVQILIILLIIIIT